MDVDFSKFSNKGVLLFLGTKQSGKTTCINSIFNYIEHADIQDVMANSVIEAAPQKLHVLDAFDLHTVTIGPENEAEAQTKNTSMYTYAIAKETTRISLIDTPGIIIPNECEEVKDKNSLTCLNILNFISKLACNDSLRAICLVLAPTDNIQAVLEFFSTYIFAMLDNTILKNIMFIFTHTDQTKHQTDVPRCLLEAVEAVQKIPPYYYLKTENNVFFMDNEALGYIVGTKKHLLFDTSYKTAFAKKWKFSQNETHKLLSYIIGSKPLYPLYMKNKNTLNEALKLISQLTMPLVDTWRWIGENLALLEIHDKRLNSDDITLNEFKDKYFVPFRDFKITPLEFPHTVCLNKCEQATNKTENICCGKCILKKPVLNVLGDAALENCECIDENRNCKMCGCSLNSHMHVYYTIKSHDRLIFDKEEKKNTDRLISLDDATDERRFLVEKIRSIKECILEERNKVLDYIVKFGHFQQDCMFSILQKSFRDYLIYLLMYDDTLQLNKEYVEESLLKFDEMVKKYNNFSMILSNQGLNRQLFTKDEIFKAQRELYNLAWCGKKINEFYKAQFKSMENEHQSLVKYVNCSQIFVNKKQPKYTKQKSPDAKSNSPKKSNKIKHLPIIEDYFKPDDDRTSRCAQTEMDKVTNGILKIEIIQTKNGTTTTNIQNISENLISKQQNIESSLLEKPPTYDEAIASGWTVIDAASANSSPTKSPTLRGNPNNLISHSTDLTGTHQVISTGKVCWNPLLGPNKDQCLDRKINNPQNLFHTEFKCQNQHQLQNLTQIQGKTYNQSHVKPGKFHNHNQGKPQNQNQVKPHNRNNHHIRQQNQHENQKTSHHQNHNHGKPHNQHLNQGQPHNSNRNQGKPHCQEKSPNKNKTYQNKDHPQHQNKSPPKKNPERLQHQNKNQEKHNKNKAEQPKDNKGRQQNQQKGNQDPNWLNLATKTYQQLSNQNKSTKPSEECVIS